MTTINAILGDAARGPAGITVRAAGLALPYLLAAYILLWYLPFKFYPDSHLFQVLEDAVGLPWFEPYFRYVTGGVEAVASLLLLIPGLQVAGAAIALGTMTGAIAFCSPRSALTPTMTAPSCSSKPARCWAFAAAILALRRREILPLARCLLTDPRFGRSQPHAA